MVEQTSVHLLVYLLAGEPDREGHNRTYELPVVGLGSATSEGGIRWEYTFVCCYLANLERRLFWGVCYFPVLFSLFSFTNPLL